MNFNLALFLLAAPSLVHGGQSDNTKLRGSAVERVLGGSYKEKLGQCTGSTCAAYGDPHIVTCDGLAYDCQGIGLFTLMKNHMYNIQGNFVDIGAREHNMVESWGLTHGASITNDIIVDFLPNDDIPIIQLGFGNVSNHQFSEYFPSEEGCAVWSTFQPTDMPGQKRSVEPTNEHCRHRCESVTGCTQWSWWADGGCHINNDDQKMIDSNKKWSRALAGRTDSVCGEPKPAPVLPIEVEEAKHGTIGNFCPLLMHVDGTLVDISDIAVKHANAFLLGGPDEDFSVKLENGNDIRIAYKLDGSGETAEILLRSTGDGPGELWSCHWNFYVCLPEAEQEAFEQGGLGLLGTPNGNTQDDWMDKNGNTLEIKRHGKTKQEDAINYCYDNWCVSQMDSIMTHSEDSSYDDVKCGDHEFVDFNINDDICVLGADKIITACEDSPPLLKHACEMDCCLGGCEDMIVISDDIKKLKELSTEDEDIQYDIPVHTDCQTDNFLNTGDSACPGSDESIVTLVKSSGSLGLPAGAEVFYAIRPDAEPVDDVTGKSVRFHVNNPFGFDADMYVKHEKHYNLMMDSTCDAQLDTTPGCNSNSIDIEVACHEYPGITPFALVEVFFQANSIALSDTDVDKCCYPSEDNNGGVVSFTFEIKCDCSDEAVA